MRGRAATGASGLRERPHDRPRARPGAPAGHLRTLEAESVHIPREVATELERPVAVGWASAVAVAVAGVRREPEAA
jgi:hypothetical protein